MMAVKAASVSEAVVFGVGAGLALLLSYAFFNVYLHPLRRYPGPWLWRAFRIPNVVSIHRGEYHQKLKRFHDLYGPVVRVAPDELSYADGSSWKDIYGHRTDHRLFERNPIWFKPTTKHEPHHIMGPNEDAHATYRRAFANAFSESSLRGQSPVVEAYLDTFINQLKAITAETREKDETVDLCKWYNFLTFDISGDLSFGESFECLKNRKAHPWVEISQDFGKALALVASTNLYPPFNKLLKFIIPTKIRQRRMQHRELSEAKAKKRLAWDTNRPDFVTPTKKFTEKKGTLAESQWSVNMTILIFAGSETTASALVATTRCLVQNRGALYRLTQEIRHSFANESEIKISSTSNLQYLNAVINEGLRLCPPVVVGMPRVVPKGGDSICGQWVSGGTYVAFNQFSATRQYHNFQYPNSFIPERFLDPDPKTNDFSAFQPFGLGRHNCIGMKLAYAMLRVILARLLFAFDMELTDKQDTWDWGEQKTYIFWDKRPLSVKLHPAIQI